MKKGHRHWPEALREIDANGAIAATDTKIVRINRDLKILRYINPINSSAERDLFFQSRYRHVPQFRYLPLQFDSAAMRRGLAHLPVGKIRDEALARIYTKKRDELESYLDLVEAVAKPEFTWVSRKLFGPSRASAETTFLDDAQHFASIDPEFEAATLTPKQAQEILQECVHYYVHQASFRCTIKIREHLSANAAAGEQSVVIRDNTRYNRSEVRAMAEHEISIHVLTAQNGFSQPLKIFGAGLPGYLQDQEGYAVFSEYMSRVLSPSRLRMIGGRALAVDRMLRGMSFPAAFEALVEGYRFSLADAFSICERAYRGGGYTKDSIYFQGFVDVFKSWISGMDLSIFSLGKMSIQDVPYVERLLKQGILHSPRILPRFMATESMESRRALFRLFSRQDVKDFYTFHSKVSRE